MFSACSPGGVCSPSRDPFEEDFKPRQMPKKVAKKGKKGRLSPEKDSRPSAKRSTSLALAGQYAPLSARKWTVEIEKLCKKRRKVIDELISTEETYVDNLKKFQSIFVKPLKRTGVVPKDALKTLQTLVFTPMKRMLVFHEEFLSSLQDSENVAEVFKQKGDFLKMNNDFCSRHPATLQEISKLRREHIPFNQFLQEKESKRANIQSFLILPIQRVPRYKMLLEDLLKKTQKDHKQREILEYAVDHISMIASQINEYSRNYENMNELYDISTRIRGRSDSLWQANRRFLWKEPCWRKSDTSAFNEAKLGFWFLFSDIIVIVSEGYKFRRELCLLDIDEVKPVFLASHALRNDGGRSSLISLSKSKKGADSEDENKAAPEAEVALTSPKRAPNLYGLELSDRANPDRPCTIFATTQEKREKWQNIIGQARDDLEQEMQEGVKNRLFAQPESGNVTTIFMKMGTKVFVARRMKSSSELRDSSESKLTSTEDDKKEEASESKLTAHKKEEASESKLTKRKRPPTPGNSRRSVEDKT